MKQFNTHGGYFAPQGYTRINEGGSHGENPNGGVQLGVDPNGIPNMVEENEPIYDDFVYSDNIKADKNFLSSNNIPEKYAGKLYSEVADSIISEAKERPLDAVSTNGLRVMLSRLAKAQESQKQASAQKELEKEIESLSPEELAQLEQVLLQQEQLNSVPAEAEQIPSIQQPELQMFCGGKINKFQTGGDKETQRMFDSVTARIQDDADRNSGISELTGLPYELPLEDIHPGLDVALAISQPGSVAAKLLAPSIARNTVRSLAAGEGASALLYGLSPTLRPANGVNKLMDQSYAELAAEKAAAKAAAAQAGRSSGRTSIGSILNYEPKTGFGRVSRALLNPGGAILSKWKPSTVFGKIAKPVSALSIDTGIYSGLGRGIQAVQEAYRNPFDTQDVSGSDNTADFSTYYDLLNEYGGYARGGRINKYSKGGPTDDDDEIQGGELPAATVIASRPISEIQGEELPAAIISAELPIPEIQGGELSEASVAAESSLPTIEPATAFAQNESGLKLSPRLTNPWGAKLPKLDSDLLLGGDTSAQLDEPETKLAGEHTYSKNTYNPQEEEQKPFDYTTFLRYAPALASAAKGLYNAFQSPDRYEIPTYSPVLPEERMHLQDPYFIPIDTSMLVNSALSGHGATARQLRSAGLGPSTGASLVAADNNFFGTLGNAMSEAVQTNNQMRNSVIGQRNSNAQTLGNFRFGVDNTRAQIQNDSMLRNIQNSLMQQRLNNAAESEKYAAIGNEIDSSVKSLAGIGTENFRMNAANSMSYYVILPDGRTAYAPKVNSGKCGGTLLKKYK